MFDPLSARKVVTPERLAESGTEHGEQTALFCWAQQNLDHYPELALMFAIPNGGERTKSGSGRLKAEGVKPGVPDIFLPVARGKYHGLFIEMKKRGVFSVSQEQRDWAIQLAEQHYRVVLAIGWLNAKMLIEKYFLS